MLNTPKKPPLLREKWLLDELSPEARAAFERDVPGEERQQLKEEDASLRDELFTQVPPNLLRARVNSKLAASTPRRRVGFFTLAPALGVVVASALLLMRPVENDSHMQRLGADSPNSERIKGLAPRVVIFRQKAHQSEELRNGAEVRAHDVLQLGYVGGGRDFGVLLSIDGRGLVTLHAPGLPNAEAALSQDTRTQLLERAYELDDAPTFERFFFVTSEHALNVNQVLNAAEQLARDPARAMRDQLTLGASIEQSSVLLHKPSAP